MAEIAGLDIKVDSREVTPAKKALEDLTRAGERAEGAVQDLGKAAEKAAGGISRAGGSARDSSGQIDRMGRSATDAAGGFGALGLAISAATAAAAVMQYAKTADSVTVLNNQLKLATGSAQAASSAYEQLYAIAQRSGVSFTELGGTFASIARSGAQLGVSQQRLLTVTESISNAMAVGGGSAQGMQAALIQLGQGIASGTLRGEELNSVIEQTPRLAQAIADGLGVPIGKLREMGAAGQITAEAVITALESQAAVLKGEVASSQMTVEQSMTRLSNATTLAVGEFDKATGASKAIVDAINSVTSAVDATGAAFKNNETAIKTTLGVMGGGAAAAGLVTLALNLGKVRIAVMALSAVLAANPVTLALLGIGAAVGGFVAYNAAQEKTVDGIKRTIAALEEQAKAPHIYDRNPEGIKKWEAENVKRLEQIKKLRAEVALLTSAGDAESAAEAARLGATKAAQAANNKLTDTYEKLSESLGGLRGKNSEYQQSLKDIQALREAGLITEKKANEWLTELAKKHGEAGKAAKKGAKQVDEFAQALDAVQDKQSGLSGDYDKKLAALYAGYQKGRIGVEAYGDAVGALIKQQPFYAAQLKAQADAEKVIADAREKARKLADQDIDTAAKSADQVAANVQRLREENELIGLTTEARAKALILREQQVIAEREIELIGQQNAGTDEVKLQLLEREINLRKQLVNQMQIGADKTEAVELRKKTEDAAKDAAKSAADEFDRAAQQIEQSLTDALMNGGKSGAEYLEGLFRTLILRPVISAIVNPIAQGVQGMVGGIMGGGGGGGGASALGSAASSAGTSALFGGTSLGALGTGLGSGLGMITGGGIGGWLTASTSLIGTGTAAGAMAGIGALAGPIGAVLAIGSLLKSLDDSGTMHTGGLGSYSYKKGQATGDVVKEQSPGFFNLASSDYQKSSETASVQLAKGIVDILDSTASAFGKDAGYYAATAFADDTSKDGAWGGLTVKLADKIVADWGSGGDGFLGKVFADGEKGAKEYAAAVGKDVRDYLLTQTPEWADEMLMALGDAPSIDALEGAVKSINDLQKELKAAGLGSLFEDITKEAKGGGRALRTDLVPWMQRIADKGGPMADTLKTIASYPNELLTAAGTGRDELVKIYAEGFQSGNISKAGQAVADTLVTSIENTMLTGAAGQIFDIANRGIITPILDAMLNGQTLSQALADGAIDATITKIKEKATALATVMNDPRIKELMDGLKTSLGGALGGGAAVNYTPQYQPPPTKAVDQSQSDAEKAAQDAKKITDDLTSKQAELWIEKLRAQGRAEEALALEREAAIKGMNKEQIALYDTNQQLQKQIDLLNSASAMRSEFESMGVELLRAQGKEAEALAEQRRLDVKGMTQSEIELYDLNAARRKEIDSIIKNKEAIENLWQTADSVADKYLSGDALKSFKFENIARQINAVVPVGVTGALLGSLGVSDIQEAVRQFVLSDAAPEAKAQILSLGGALIDIAKAGQSASVERLAAAVAAERDAAEKRITELEKTFAATDAALAAVDRAADAQRKALNEQLQAAQKAETSLKSVFDLLNNAVREMRGEVKATADMQYAEARRIIDVARLTGVMPDQERLGFAVTAARKGVAGAQYGSRFERDKASVLLANDLDKLRGMSEGQLSTAERSVVLLEGQLKSIDLQVQAAHDSVEVMRGADKSIKALPDALALLQPKVAAEQQARAQIETLKKMQLANEATLKAAQDQLVALNGVNASVLSVAEAVKGLGSLIGALTPSVTTIISQAPATGSINYGPQAVGPSVTGERLANTAIGDAYYVPAFASGGRYSGGLALVGEQGPELINFDSGGYVANAQNTRAMMQGGGSGAEVEALKSELEEIKGILSKIASNTRLASSILDDVTQNGTALRTTTA